MKRHTTSHLLSSLSVLALATLPASAFAQAEDTGSTGGLSEIVVTAQKKAESIQSVPISIAAVGGEQLTAMNVTTLQALQGSVPNVQIDNFANTPNNAVFTIRGIGVIEPDPYAGNTVSIVVDGVPQFFSMGALLDTYDTGRVEILRGPQGTLFGANTTGGVVNVVTNQPTGDFGGYVRGTYGNWKRFDVNASIEAPLVKDVVSVKVAGIHTQRDGWVTNVWNGEDMGRKNVDAVRGQLYITPSPDLKITLQGEYVAARNGAPIVVNGGLPGEANYVPEGTFWNGAVLPMYRSPCAVAGRPCKAPDKYFSGNNEVPDQSDMTTKFFIGTIQYDNTPLGDITAITGYKRFTLFEYTDQDGTAKTNNATRRRTRGWQFSQELRSAFSAGDSFNAVAGLFYLKTHYNHYQMYHLDFALPGLIQYNVQDQGTESFSAFLQSYTQITDALKFSAGIRYTHDSIDARATLDTGLGSQPLTSAQWDKFDVTFPGSLDVGGKKSWGNVGWKLGLDYETGRNQLIYASWARGFKSGGYTGRIGVAADGDTPYNPEKVDTFEVGLKADFLDRRLRTNFAAFYTNYRDMQVAQIYFDPATNVQGNRILNAAKSEIKGFELEVQAVPVDGFTLRGSLAYLDTKYKSFLYFDPVAAKFIDLKGYALQNAPKWASTLGANFTHAFADDSSIVADVSWMYTGQKFYTAVVNTPRSSVQPTYYVDALLTYYGPEKRYSIGLWGKNLFDKRYISTVYDSPGYMGIVGYAPPRQFGVSAGYNF
ncbi:TonB-dependent receptor [Novosphingobium taihuense]|uniref:Iron complex outermembrane receptor protein n=1 Tax=Novosphingobium taihuense TaxID=260085 RepID=A0A7W7AEK2_9SPHN|nr:TonB-dependent receptor [Novosphingobium taihuense]MBB4614894.1 iron complex outermembrane receptor protein [Novosphingobium taihuense]TWH84665.1 iron complex outermembrane receptor protein [Novosphingobium taihuense]